MTDAPEQTWIQWPYRNATGLAFSCQARPPALRTQYTRTDLIRQGVEEACEAVASTLAEKLRDPVAVHANMLRGTVAKPTLAQIAHLYPEVRALVEAATPYVSPVQNADYGRQLREYEALNAALAPFTKGDEE